MSILLPQKRAIKLPITKNGPKAIVCPKCFFPITISKTEKIAPIKKEAKRATKDRGNPNINPKNPPNFTSPPPIPLPLVITIKPKKKDATVAPIKIEYIKGSKTIKACL